MFYWLRGNLGFVKVKDGYSRAWERNWLERRIRKVAKAGRNSRIAWARRKVWLEHGEWVPQAGRAIGQAGENWLAGIETPKVLAWKNYLLHFLVMSECQGLLPVLLALVPMIIATCIYYWPTVQEVKSMNHVALNATVLCGRDVMPVTNAL